MDTQDNTQAEHHRVTVTTNVKPLFNAGTIMALFEAEDMLNKHTGSREKTTEMITQFVGRHITGDFGLMPAENVTQNIHRIAAGKDCLMSCYSLDGRTDPFKMDEPAFAENCVNLLTFNVGGDEIVTYVASNDEIRVLFMGRSVGMYFKPDDATKKPGDSGSIEDKARDLMVKLVGMTPVGHA